MGFKDGMNNFFATPIDDCRDFLPYGSRRNVNYGEMVSRLPQTGYLDSITTFDLFQLSLSKYRAVMDGTVKLNCNLGGGDENINFQLLRKYITSIRSDFESWKLPLKTAYQISFRLAAFEFGALDFTPLHTVFHCTRFRAVGSFPRLDVTWTARNGLATQCAWHHNTCFLAFIAAPTSTKIKANRVLTPQNIVNSIFRSNKGLMTDLATQRHRIPSIKFRKFLNTNQKLHILISVVNRPTDIG